MADNATKGAAGGAVSGAASGAAIGSVVPGIGTAVGAVVGGIIGGIGGFMSGSAADDAEKLAELQVKFKRMETAENLRRMRREAEYTVGLAKSQVYASNLQFDGSPRRHVSAIAAQKRMDQAWMLYASKQEQNILENGGQIAADGIMSNLYASQIRQLGSAAVSLYSPAPATDGGPLGPGTSADYLKSIGVT